MPNHCTNLLSCTSGKTIGQVIKPYLTKDEKSIDFHKIIPVPYPVHHIEKLYGIGEDWDAPEDQKLPQWFKDQAKALADALGDYNEKTYGHRNAYNFHVDKWDTKWNSYNCYSLEEDSFDELTDIGFQTAWSPPINVIRQLAKITGECFRMSYYDEGWMFAGEYFANADGSEIDNCYEDMDQIPEGSELYHECDLPYFYELRAEQEENEDEEV
jgi:hypothetical protein